MAKWSLMLEQVERFVSADNPAMLTLKFDSPYDAHLAMARLEKSKFKFLAARRDAEVYVFHSKKERDAVFPRYKWNTRPKVSLIAEENPNE